MIREKLQNTTTASTNCTEVSLTPGIVKKSQNFTIRYITADGKPTALCCMPEKGVAFTTLRSPSGTGKSTLLQRFVSYLRDDSQGTADDLGFLVSNKKNTPPPLYICMVPQSPSFVKHWGVSRLLSKNSWAAHAAFGTEWQKIYNRKMGELSGGQQRRVYASSVLARILLKNNYHAILVLDETLDGLGQQGSGDFITNISNEWSKNSSGSLYILLVTHLYEVNTAVPEVVRATLSIEEENQSGLIVCVKKHDE